MIKEILIAVLTPTYGMEFVLETCFSCALFQVIAMAFLSKFGNILRQTANKQIKSELSPFKPSILQAIRCMSTGPSSKLFIGGALLIAQITFSPSLVG